MLFPPFKVFPFLPAPSLKSVSASSWLTRAWQSFPLPLTPTLLRGWAQKVLSALGQVSQTANIQVRCFTRRRWTAEGGLWWHTRPSQITMFLLPTAARHLSEEVRRMISSCSCHQPHPTDLTRVMLGKVAVGTYPEPSADFLLHTRSLRHQALAGEKTSI